MDLGDEETGAALLNGGVEQQDGGKGGDGDGDAAFVARFKAGRLRTSLALGGCIVFVAGGERCEAVCPIVSVFRLKLWLFVYVNHPLNQPIHPCHPTTQNQTHHPPL